MVPDSSVRLCATTPFQKTVKYPGVTLPVNNGGRIGSGQDTKVDVKTSMPVNRVTTAPSNNGQVMKLNNNPPLGNSRVNFQGNSNNGYKFRFSSGQYIYNLAVPSNATSGTLYTILVRPFGGSAPTLYAVLKIK